MEKEIKMKFGDSEVFYDVRHQTWTLEGVSEATMVKIAPEKAAAINVALAKEVAEYQERITKKEAEEKALDVAKKQAMIDAFKVQVEPLLPAGFTARFASADSPYSSIVKSVFEVVVVQKDARADATIRFADKVYRGFHSHTTNSPWQVEFDYKNTRYATLDKAIKSACKKIDEKIVEQSRKKAVQDMVQKATQNEAAYLAEQGIQLVTEPGSSFVKKARIVVNDPTPEAKYGKMLVVVSGNLLSSNNSYEVRHLTISGSFTLEQFKKLADAVKEINPEPASNY